MTLSHTIENAKVLLRVHGQISSTFDFTTAGFCPELAKSFARALVGQYGHTSLETQRQSWRCLRKFASFLHAANIPQEPRLPPDVLFQFREWLAASGLAGSTAQSVLNVVSATLKWCSRNAPTALAPDTVLQVKGFVREAPRGRAQLSKDELKKILAACYEEIEEAELRLSAGARVLGNNPANEEERRLAKLVSQLLKLGQGELPHLVQINNSRLGLGPSVHKLGGTTALLRSLWISTETIFPFFLAILAQVSGNPYSILAMTRSCVSAHPLREDLERVTWTKFRSHAEQHAEFPKGKRWSAPELCRRLLKLTEPVLDKCPPQDKDKLFVCKRKGREVGVMKVQMLHLLLDSFISRHDLPNFDFKDLRKAGAVAHHLETGSIISAQKRLNHRSPVTTARYTQLQDRSEEHDAVIRRFQGQLMGGAKDKKVDLSGPQEPKAGFETAFGFLCGDPFAGTAPGSVVGKLCLEFQKCATCPGALIPLDDPRIVARLLATKAALEDAKKRSVIEGWWPRFRDAYEPTRVILEQELLPAVAPVVIERAAALPTPAALLHLE